MSFHVANNCSVRLFRLRHCQVQNCPVPDEDLRTNSATLCIYPFSRVLAVTSAQHVLLPCVVTLHNVVQFIWVPNPLCHDTEWSGVLLNLFVPPRMKIADGSGPGSVDSTHSVLMPTQHPLHVVATCQ